MCAYHTRTHEVLQDCVRVMPESDLTAVVTSPVVKLLPNVIRTRLITHEFGTTGNRHF